MVTYKQYVNAQLKRGKIVDELQESKVTNKKLIELGPVIQEYINKRFRSIMRYNRIINSGCKHWEQYYEEYGKDIERAFEEKCKAMDRGESIIQTKEQRLVFEKNKPQRIKFV
jgi:hypothetical protein|tara:strand:+ start:130 stop:468 length:339 start_codon:yes stop_codon:yes gene_type:complete